MGFSLYELNKALETVIECGFVFDQLTGEVIFDDTDLDELQAAFEDKLEACALYLKNLESDAEAIKAEEKALADRRRVIERKADRMKRYVRDCVGDMDGQRFETPKVALSMRRSKIVDVWDCDEVPEKYLVRKQTVQPDKKAIKKAIESGENIPGAAIVENWSLQVK